MAEFVGSDGPVKLGPKNILPSYTTVEREALETIPAMLVLDTTTGTLWYTDDANVWQELGLA